MIAELVGTVERDCLKLLSKQLGISVDSALTRQTDEIREQLTESQKTTLLRTWKYIREEPGRRKAEEIFHLVFYQLTKRNPVIKGIFARATSQEGQSDEADYHGTTQAHEHLLSQLVDFVIEPTDAKAKEIGQKVQGCSLLHIGRSHVKLESSHFTASMWGDFAQCFLSVMKAQESIMCSQKAIDAWSYFIHMFTEKIRQGFAQERQQQQQVKKTHASLKIRERRDLELPSPMLRRQTTSSLMSPAHRQMPQTPTGRSKVKIAESAPSGLYMRDAPSRKSSRMDEVVLESMTAMHIHPGASRQGSRSPSPRPGDEYNMAKIASAVLQHDRCYSVMLTGHRRQMPATPRIQVQQPSFKRRLSASPSRELGNRRSVMLDIAACRRRNSDNCASISQDDGFLHVPEEEDIQDHARPSFY